MNDFTPSYDIIKNRHSVRAFTTEPISQEVRRQLDALIVDCNNAGQLSISAVFDSPDAFGKSKLASYGKFSNADNYICMAAADNPDPRIALGYYGEKLVLWLQSQGLGSCWVGLTFSKKNIGIDLGPDNKLYCLIAFGHPAFTGSGHKIKAPTDICPEYEQMPDWFKRGVDYALLAPTALNQQKFKFSLLPDGSVKESTSMGFYTKIDMGIARYHFELGAAPHVVKWA